MVVTRVEAVLELSTEGRILGKVGSVLIERKTNVVHVNTFSR